MLNSYQPLGTYYLYGHFIRSPWPLPYLPLGESNSVDFEILIDSAPFLSEEIQSILGDFADKAWFYHARLSSGSDLVHWTGLFDFLISTNGRKIIGHSLTGDTLESFQTYLLGQALSFAMVRQGVEPLHSTVVVKDGQAVAFLGDCGYGKSTLAGAFLQAGFQILTDDMLVIKERDGGFLAYPGPPRIKLFPEVAEALLAEEVVGTPMNPSTTKLIIPLSANDVAQSPTPLQHFYALQPPDTHSGKVTIERLSQSQALLAFVQNTFNTVIRGPERLTQQFNFATKLAANLPVKSLSYPRELAWLPKVVDAILNDVA